MSADWYPGIRAFCAHWKHAPMLQETFAALEREFNEENDACIDAAKGLVECACRVLIEELDNPVAPLKPEATDTPLGQLVGLATLVNGGRKPDVFGGLGGLPVIGAGVREMSGGCCGGGRLLSGALTEPGRRL